VTPSSSEAIELVAWSEPDGRTLFMCQEEAAARCICKGLLFAVDHWREIIVCSLGIAGVLVIARKTA